MTKNEVIEIGNSTDQRLDLTKWDRTGNEYRLPRLLRPIGHCGSF